MSEVIHAFRTPVIDGGVVWQAEARGAQRDDGLWEGWLLFASAAGDVLLTSRETTQPNRNALEYWATGLEPVFLEGAFERAKTRAAA
jgi:hypothetical protein